MKKESDCKPQIRFLSTDALFSDETILEWQNECIKRSKAAQDNKPEAFGRFVNWKRSKNEIAVFTPYAYADLAVPLSYDCIINLNSPNEVVFADFEITQVIYEGWLPTDRIEEGYKHLCILRFKDETPAIFEQLHVSAAKFSDVPSDATRLGFCKRKDLEEIKKRRLYINQLQGVHGAKWWQFDEEQKE